MGCQATLTLSQPQNDMPFQDATYAPSVDKIFGVMGPYLVKCNATTGARESSVRVTSPVLNDCRLAYHAATDTVYVATWNEPNLQWYSLTHPNRDIYPVNPATMVVAPRLNVPASDPLTNYDFSTGSFFGPRCVMSAGNYLYVRWQSDVGASNYARFNPTNIADHNTQAGATQLVFWAEHAGIGGGNIFVPNPWGPRIDFAPLNYDLNGDWDNCPVPAYIPIACAYADNVGKCYVACGDTNLLRIDNPAGGLFTPLLLGPVQANADPCRIRYRTSNQKLYLPCMTANGILIWNPATDLPGDAVFKTGFDNPVDVVFTPTKAFAVQNSSVGLKEIT